MLRAVIAWFREYKRLRCLRAGFLVERNEIAFYSAWGEFQEDYDEALDKIRQKYITLGLTANDIEQVEQSHPWVRIE